MNMSDQELQECIDILADERNCDGYAQGLWDLVTQELRRRRQEDDALELEA